MSSAAAHEPASHAARTASARVAELFERHGRMVYGICRTMLRDPHEAEDATQQAFLSAHRAFLGGARVRDQGAWIATIARNECRARISAGMRAPLPAPGEDLAEVPHDVDEIERRLQLGELRDALAELPERQREAVVLRYVYGLRYGEVAKALGLSRPATEALLFRARRAMRLRLRPAAATVLVVPLAVREELALAIPGFQAQAASGAAAAGVAGGVLAKLASAPAAAKLVTATVAVSTVGAVGAVEADRPVPGAGAPSRLEAEPSRADLLEASSAAEARGDWAHEEDESGFDGGQDSDGSDDPGGGRDGASSRASAGDEREVTQSTPRGGRPGADEDDRGRDEDEGADDEQADSSGPGSSEVDASVSEADDDGSESGTSARAAEDSGSSGPGSGEPDQDEGSGEEEDSSGSGSSGSDSDDDSGHSGSDDEPDDETP